MAVPGVHLNAPVKPFKVAALVAGAAVGYHIGPAVLAPFGDESDDPARRLVGGGLGALAVLLVVMW